MNRNYKGGGCGCGGTPMLPQNGGDNNNNSSTNNIPNNSSNNSTNNSPNNTNNSGGIMDVLKGFMGGQNMPNSSGGPSDGTGGPSNGNSQPVMKKQARQMKTEQKSRRKGMSNSSNGIEATPSNSSGGPSNGNSQPMMKKQASQRRSRQKGRRKMNAQQVNGQEVPQMSAEGEMPRMKSRKEPALKAKEIVFNNGSTLQGQVANMQQDLNSITGKKKQPMEGGQNNLATLHNKINTIGNIVEDIKNSNNSSNSDSNSNSGLFGGNSKGYMYGGQNNLATLHNKVNTIGTIVDEIKNSNNNNNSSFDLFGGKRPMANTFLEKRRNGGGIFDNIGSMFTMNANSQGNAKVNSSMPIEPINTSVETPELVARAPVRNSELPDPTSVINRSNMEESENVEQPTGGNESSFVNSLFGGYKATKRNRKYLKRYRRGKSIGFTMKASLKAKGLIKRANGTKRVSKKYRG